MELEKIIGGEKYTVKVITGDPSDTLTENEKEMDYRARKAVEMAIEKARICQVESGGSKVWISIRRIFINALVFPLYIG